MDLEIEELLLSCYISSVINHVRKDIQKHGVKKVHFGEVFVKEYTLEEEYIEALEDTLPIDRDYITLQSLGMDVSFEDTETPYCNWFESSPYEESSVAMTTSVDRNIETYEEFLNGARKRLFMNMLKEKDTRVKSPDRKKAKIITNNYSCNSTLEEEEEFPMEADSNFRCSTPEHGDDVIAGVLEDVLTFLRYHVFSYAINTYLSNLTTYKARNCQRESQRNTQQMFFNLFAEKRSSQLTKPVAVVSTAYTREKDRNNTEGRDSYGVLLAADILKQNSIGNNKQKTSSPGESVVIRNHPSKNDFPDQQSYVRFIQDHKNNNQALTNEKLQFSQNKFIDETLSPQACGMIPIQEIRTYLMPETDEPSLDPVDVTCSVNTLRPEILEDTSSINIAGDRRRREEFTERNRDSQYTILNRDVKFVDSSIVPVDQNSDHSLFDDETLIESLSPPIIHQSTNDCVNLISSYAATSPDTVPTNVIDGEDLNCDVMNTQSSIEYNINDMLSELMVSQALRSNDGDNTHQHVGNNRFNKFMKPVSMPTKRRRRVDQMVENENKYDGIVPSYCDAHLKEHKNDNVTLHGDFEDFSRKETNQKSHTFSGSSINLQNSCDLSGESDDQTVPTYLTEKDNSLLHTSSSFTWNKTDSVVPFSHELFINSPSKLKTPQKIRLGLSKKIKVKSTLHPYKKT